MPIETSTSAKQVLISGGTGSVGRALCQAFVQSGFKVTFQYFKQKKQALALERDLGAIAWKCDFGQMFALDNPKFDILINNAGINISDELTRDVKLADWTRTLQVNLTASFLLIQQCLPWMLRRKWGRIINISSIYGIKAVEGNAPYTASKHAMNGLTKTVAKEYGLNGVTCNAICPGAIESEMMHRIAARSAEEGGTAEEYLEQVRKGNPTGRMCAPEDVAHAALFLTTPTAGHINGAILPIDGGTIV